MDVPMTRRTFVAAASLAAFAPAWMRRADPPFRISLAQWSVNRAIKKGDLDHLDFAPQARTRFGIDAVEYVNTLFSEKPTEQYLGEMRKRAAGEGVSSLLIMCDGLGRLGDPDQEARRSAVRNHAPWLEAAESLGCHSIRVNAASEGAYEEQQKLAADGLRRLTTTRAAARCRTSATSASMTRDETIRTRGTTATSVWLSSCHTRRP